MLSCFLALTSAALVETFQEKSFLNWMRTNNQFYTGDEYHFRLGIYLANSRFVQEHNRGNYHYKVSLNKFSAYTPAEYKTMLGEMNAFSTKNIPKSQSKKNWPTPPEQLDWRESGAVNEIVDQGSCGSCWAFGAIAGAEGCWFINKGELLKFSEQNLVDCVTTCDGCAGGTRDTAYTYIIENQNGQFNLASDYPYTAKDEFCKYDSTTAVGGIRGYVQPTPLDEDDLLAHVAHYGPTTVGIDASGSGFMEYNSGIYDRPENCNPDGINHGVCCVGYGEENGIKYWIVRNSWGAEWGEGGFIRMGRYLDQCGISRKAYSVYYDNQ
ncbi:hypothetical protein M9Y10_031174 [Tritrichomonas musculus]|uniref:Uncharacterized protein n=1 Tax=Tritrichomonas musculus TaxID=1915356 RepID=A0ABR2H1Z7_9EUKA